MIGRPDLKLLHFEVKVSDRLSIVRDCTIKNDPTVGLGQKLVRPDAKFEVVGQRWIFGVSVG